MEASNGFLYGTCTGGIYKCNPSNPGDTVFLTVGDPTYFNATASLTEVDICVTTATKLKNGIITALDDGAIYQWIDCDNNKQAIAGAINNSFTPSQPGNYAVIITKNGCTDTSECITVSSINTSIGNIKNEANLIKVYPNPNNGSFTLESTQAGVFFVINQLGQIVQKIDLRSKNSIVIDGLSPGIYFIKSDAGLVLNKKIVVVN